MLTTVDGSNNDGILVNGLAKQLSGIRKLKEPLANLGHCAVYLIEEEKDRGITRRLKPVGRAERGNITVGLGQANEITLGHLRSATLHDGEPHRLRNLINNLGLANSVAASEKHRLVNCQDVRRNLIESFEINSHLELLCSGLG
jgi:hypothetical protein